MELLKKILKLDDDQRKNTIVLTSTLGIVVNLLIAVAKILIGVLASSIAIISEGVHNVTDAMTSFLSLIGVKLADKRPTEKHPFGYGRIEYLASLTIAVLILVAGVEMLLGSFKLILKPAELSVTYGALVFIAATAVVKYWLGVYTIRKGKDVDSSSLVAIGLEGRNDAFISAVTIASGLVFLVLHYSVDAYVGVFRSFIVNKTGVDVLLESVGQLLGRAGKKELADQLYREILETEGIINAADMILHNYGPNAWSGSVNVEVDHSKTVGEVYLFLHSLQLRIMHEHNVTMVFGVYATGIDHKDYVYLRELIVQFVQGQKHIKNFHALYLDSNTNRIYCDFVVDYDLEDWDALREEFIAYMAGFYPDKEVYLTIETEFV